MEGTNTAGRETRQGTAEESSPAESKLGAGQTRRDDTTRKQDEETEEQSGRAGKGKGEARGTDEAPTGASKDEATPVQGGATPAELSAKENPSCVKEELNAGKISTEREAKNAEAEIEHQPTLGAVACTPSIYDDPPPPIPLPCEEQCHKAKPSSPEKRESTYSSE